MNKDIIKEIVLATFENLGEAFGGGYSPLAPKVLSAPDIPIDIRDLADVSAGTVRERFLSFVCPKGYEAIFTHYGIFCDAQFANQVEFWPTIGKKRVYPYQGTPNPDKPEATPFKISLGVSSDLSETSLIHAPLSVKEGEELIWALTNTAATSQTMGVRMRGFLRSVNKQSDTRIGG